MLYPDDLIKKAFYKFFNENGGLGAYSAETAWDAFSKHLEPFGISGFSVAHLLTEGTISYPHPICRCGNNISIRKRGEERCSKCGKLFNAWQEELG